MGRDALPPRNCWDSGTLHRSTLAFQKVVGEVTGTFGCSISTNRPGRLQTSDRRTNLGRHRHADGLGLDHLLSEQEASSDEIEAVSKWLQREGTCLLLGPHRDVGFTEDLQQRQLEYPRMGMGSSLASSASGNTRVQ